MITQAACGRGGNRWVVLMKVFNSVPRNQEERRGKLGDQVKLSFRYGLTQDLKVWDIPGGSLPSPFVT